MRWMKGLQAHRELSADTDKVKDGMMTTVSRLSEFFVSTMTKSG
jgi:hypothetical protein